MPRKESLQLGDRRGYEFLLSAMMSEDEAMRDTAQEIFDSPELAKMRSDIEAERERVRRTHIESARKRLQNGGKVFRYKMVYLPSGALMGDDLLGEGYDIPALEAHGWKAGRWFTCFPVAGPCWWEASMITLPGLTSCSRRNIFPVKVLTWITSDKE